MRGLLVLTAAGLLAGCSAEYAETNTTANASASNLTTTTTVASDAPAPAPEHHSGLFGGHLTRDKYDQITDGMSYQQVVEIIGREGNELSSAGDGEYKAVTYEWQNFSGSNAIIEFQGDKVMAKAQNGLF